MSQSVRWLIAKKVTLLRKKMKLNREELSLKLGVDNSYISKLEHEKINITIDKLEKLAEILNIPVKNFFED